MFFIFVFHFLLGDCLIKRVFVYTMFFIVCVTSIKVAGEIFIVLFVVGAASLRPSRCKQNSRDFFAAPFLEYYSKGM